MHSCALPLAVCVVVVVVVVVAVAAAAAATALPPLPVPDADPAKAAPPGPYVVPPARLASAAYPEWAHHHWVWLASRDGNQTSDLALVADYLARDVPVGAINIDSRWATGINSFVFDKHKFPDAKSMIAHFHSLGVRVIAWATSVINTDSPNYEFAKKNNYFLNYGRTLKWWHGHGSWIDYFNPDGLRWWHEQLDQVLSLGLDGFKCDGTDPFVLEFVVIESYKGFITEREYADAYYRDFLYHARTRNKDALIMARPVNDYWSFAPKDTMYSGWVGDNDPTFTGLSYALNDMLQSAWRGYLNFGSDTGGYRTGGAAGGPLGRTAELLLRWAQLSTFTPLFENGGENEHRPWRFDAPGSNFTLDTYRAFVTVHMELNPFFMASGAAALAANRSQITPLGKDEGHFYPSSWDYMLGWPRPSVFVSPITKNNTRALSVTFPQLDATATTTWVHWWTNATYAGGSTARVDVPLDRYAVFKRAGALLPLDVSTDYSTHGDRTSAGHLTLLLHAPFDTERGDEVRVAEWRGGGVVARYRYDAAARRLSLRVSAYRKPLLLRVRRVHHADARARVQRPVGSGAAAAAAEAHVAHVDVQRAATPHAIALGEMVVRIDAATAAHGTVLDIDNVVPW